MAVVDTAWDGSADRFSNEQYERACVLDRRVAGGEFTDAPPKERCSLPIFEPSGDLNRHAVHAAAGELFTIDAAPEAIAAAKIGLREAYNVLSEPVPAFLRDAPDVEELTKLHAELGVTPGSPRRGVMAMRWITDPELETTCIREAGDAGDGYLGVLHGHFAVFNRWTEINSMFEGRFLESLAPGCFKKTFDENRNGMRCLWQHGRDPQAGLNPIGPIRELQEDKTGAAYEVPILDTAYNRDRLPAVREGLFGASFRFQVLREEVSTSPKRSSYNPEGIEERVIREAKVREFGPVTFPAYEGASAAVRSLNDWWANLDLDMFSHSTPERLSTLLTKLRSGDGPLEQESPPEPSAAPPQDPDREQAPTDGPPQSTVKSRSRLSGAARKLRTSRGMEVPQWKL